MADGSMAGQISETVKGVAVGTIKATINEISQSLKVAASQTAPNQVVAANNAATNAKFEPGNDQKIAAIRSQLHQQVMNLSAKPSQQITNATTQGPVEAQGFTSSHLNNFGNNSTKTTQDISVGNTRPERGRGAKG